jgi:hypothetical protein
MTTWKDIFSNLLMFAVVYILSMLLVSIKFINDNFFTSFPLLITPLVVYCIIYIKLKNKKRSGSYLKHDFALMNYTIISERPLTIKEQHENFEFEFGPFINGVSVNVFLYKTRMKTHFVIKNENGYDF